MHSDGCECGYWLNARELRAFEYIAPRYSRVAIMTFFAFSHAIPCMARWHMRFGCVRVCMRDGIYACPLNKCLFAAFHFTGMCLVHLCGYIRILCRCCVPTKQQNACIFGSSVDRPVDIDI